jgi:hypothetical protein
MNNESNQIAYDEDAAMEVAWERSALPHPRDLLKREYNESMKYPDRCYALEKWGAEIETQMEVDLED